MASTRKFNDRHIRSDMADDVEMHLNDAACLAETIAVSLENASLDNEGAATGWRIRAREIETILAAIKKLAR